jgi:hypothetical protein
MALAKNQLLIRIACANYQQAEREKAALAKIAICQAASDTRQPNS